MVDIFQTRLSLKFCCKGMASHSCSNCAAVNVTKFCSRCKMVYYCNVSCQRDDWSKHKKKCKKLAKQNKSKNETNNSKLNSFSHQFQLRSGWLLFVYIPTSVTTDDLDCFCVIQRQNSKSQQRMTTISNKTTSSVSPLYMRLFFI